MRDIHTRPVYDANHNGRLTPRLCVCVISRPDALELDMLSFPKETPVHLSGKSTKSFQNLRRE